MKNQRLGQLVHLPLTRLFNTRSSLLVLKVGLSADESTPSLLRLVKLAKKRICLRGEVKATIYE